MIFVKDTKCIRVTISHKLSQNRKFVNKKMPNSLICLLIERNYGQGFKEEWL